MSLHSLASSLFLHLASDWQEDQKRKDKALRDWACCRPAASTLCGRCPSVAFRVVRLGWFLQAPWCAHVAQVLSGTRPNCLWQSSRALFLLQSTYSLLLLSILPQAGTSLAQQMLYPSHSISLANGKPVEAGGGSVAPPTVVLCVLALLF